MIYVVATTKVKPEGRDAFIKGHKACIVETQCCRDKRAAY